MDLEGFDDAIATPRKEFKSSSFRQVIERIDDEWYFRASRSARWMDLLGDYAGSEPFILDGDALLQIILDDPLLSIGREDCTFQILHAYHILERILGEFQKRSANFQIVFWQECLHLSLNTGSSSFTVASRALARTMLFQHLLRLPFEVHVFEDLDDPSWIQYIRANKPMFIMTNNGGLCDESSSNSTAAVILCQRVFLLRILSSSAGIAVALLKGSEYRESKILTFVYEPSQNTLVFLEPFREFSRAARHTLSQDLQGAQYSLRTSDRSVGGADMQYTFFKELNILSSIQSGVPAEIIFLFIVHTLMIPTLSLREMAQVYRPLCPDLTDLIRQKFLPIVFSNAASILGSYEYPFVVDGTIFATLIAFILLGPVHPRTAIGSSLFAKAESLWAAIGGQRLDFPGFAKRYQFGGSKDFFTSIQYHKPDPAHLLEFSNPVFDEEFSSLQLSSDALEPDSPKSNMHFEAGIMLSDNRHWHNQKSILPNHQGGSKPNPETPWDRSRRLKFHHRFMVNLQVQATSLTGAFGVSLQQIVIPPAGSGKKGKQTLVRQKVVTPVVTNKSPVLSSKDRLRLKIKEEKETKQKDSSALKWKNYLSTISNYTLSQKIASIDDAIRRRKPVGLVIDLEMQLFRLHLELEGWLEEPNRDSDVIRDRYTVSILKMIKDSCQNKVLTLSAKQVLTNVLTALGFKDYASEMFVGATCLDDQRLGFSFIKLLDSRTKSLRYPFMSITEHPVVWQLRLFGDYMDRSMDSSPDKRVSFEPDAWQKQVLDGIDKNKSLLVVAPTSAGKTFISYYAMEKILRESDDGILVYVAPTKALVSQIAAEVYARFSKNLKGGSCWAIHTRDHRMHNPQTCQILVTVPEMLAIMLLSPPLARSWTPRIKRIILDEIHCIGQQEGGAVWEQIVLFSPCLIIGLSATIGSPDTFSDWLGYVQKAHGFEYEFIEHHSRYSHLRKFFYHIDGEGRFESLDKYKPTGRASFLHPIGLLSFGPRVLPDDLSLEAGDTLTLYKALVAVQGEISYNVNVLDPENFFSTAVGLLRQKDILQYESKLKEVLTDLMRSSDPCDVSSPLGRVIHSLQDPTMRSSAIDTIPSAKAFENDLLVLLADLFVKNELPAILFDFNRSNCEILAQYLLENLERLEGEWRSENPHWKQKLKEWERWRNQAKARERVSEKLEKRKKTDLDLDHSSEPSWQSSFNPDDPSPEFSFVGRRSPYSRSDLEKSIKDLRRTPQWAVHALRRGIAVHHSGMNKSYRSLVESLFRQGFVRVVIATGTLALGINAPTRTVVFCGDSPYLTALMYRQCAGRAGRRGFDLRGNVVFYGVPTDRVRRLVLSRLPTLGGNFPATATMTLRLFNLLDGSNNSDFAVHAVRSLASLPYITLNSDIGRDHLLHHLRFSIEYLRRSGLLDRSGRPINLFVIAAHLYYTEPGNLALVALMRHGVLHSICDQPDKETVKRELMLIFCNIFGRRYLSKVFSNKAYIEGLVRKYPSMIILPPLPETARNVLILHEKEILRTFTSYATTFATQHQAKIGPDNVLPLSGFQYLGSEEPSPFRVHLSNNAIPVVVRSLFVANSGHDDSFRDVSELTTTARSGLNLNGHAIPSMSHLATGYNDLEHQINAYILDFYIHGQVSTLVSANGIRSGDIWYLLQDFALTLKAINTGTQQLLQTISENASCTTTTSLEEVDMTDLKNYDADYDTSNEQSDSGSEDSNSLGIPENVSARDQKVYNLLSEMCSEFDKKFRAVWA